MADMRLRAIITAEDKASKTIKGVAGSLTGLATKALKIGAVAAAGLSVVAVKLASDLEEVSSKYDVVFRGVKDIAAPTLEKLTKDFGFSRQSALSWMSSIQDVLVPLGFARDKAAALSGTATELAVDLASFNNVPVAETQRAITAALTGEREQMKKFGVVITEAAVKQKALSMGISDGASQLTQQQKALVTLTLIQEGSADATGDFERTQGSMANQMKILKERAKELAATLGTSLIKAIKPLVSQLTEWAKSDDVQKKVEEISTAIGNWLSGSLPKVVKAIAGFVKKGVELGKMLKDNKPLLIIIGAAFAGVAAVIVGAWVAANWVIVLLIAAIGIFAAQVALMVTKTKKGIEDWKKLWSSAKEWVTNILNSIANFFKKVGSKIKTTFQNVVAWIIAKFGQFVTYLSTVPATIGGYIDSVLDWFKMLPERLGLALGFMAGKLVKFVTVDIPNFVNSTIDWFSKLPGRIWDFMVQIYTAVSDWFSKLPGRVADAVVNMYNTVRDWFGRTKDNAVSNATSAVEQTSNWFQSLPSRVGGAMRNLFNKLSSWWSAIKSNAKTWAGDIVDSVVSFFRNLPRKIANAFTFAVSSVGGVIKKFLSGASKGFNIGVSEKALGGPVSGGSPYMVGERGPELFVPNTSGRIVPNNQISNNNQVTVNFYGNIANTSNASLDAIGARLARQLQLSQQGI